MDNAQLQSMLGNADEPLDWWGINHVLRIGRSKVFVKRVPVTEEEYDNMYSTRNLYRLPMYYQYGVGSAGFGVFREIASNVKATNWVLDGSSENFALMYHHRVVPLQAKIARLPRERLDGYVRYWNGNATIRRYVEARTRARHEAIMFFEYVPYVLFSWLDRNMDRLANVMRQMRKTIEFLRAHNVVHFDCHFGNVLTDGNRMYLADFGLVLDGQFDLSARERRCLQANRFYDHGRFLAGLGGILLSRFGKLSESRQTEIKHRIGIDDGASWWDMERALLDNMDALRNDGVLRIEKNFEAALTEYRGVIDLIQDFHADMRGGTRKNFSYSQAVLRRQLKQSGFVP